MGKLSIKGNVKLTNSIPSGTGDNVLTADPTTGDLGQIGSIDTSTFIPTTLTDGYVLIGNASNIATGVAVTGDVTISNAGVTAIGSGVIVNADVNASAAISLTKLAATTASRALVSDGSGFITPSATTSTEIGYVSGVTSAIQTQIDSKISTSILTTNGDLLYRDGSGTVTRLPVGTNGYVLAVTGGLPVWEPKTPVPNGGTTGQYLAKQSATDGDVDWETLVVANITDLTATAAELNIMDGVTVTFTEINYLSGVSSNVQTQLNAKQATVTGAATTIVSSNLTASRAVIANASGKVDVSTVTSTELGYLSGVTSPLQSQLNAKLSTALAQHAILVGNASNIASTLVVGSEGQVLTVSGGTPTWVTPGSGGTVTSIDLSGGTTGLTFSGGPVTTTGTITMTGTLDETHGGTGQTTLTTGDILYASASNTFSKLAGVATGNALISGGVATAPSWGKIGLTTHVSGTLPIANGGTGLTALGTALQVLRVNAGGTALEYATIGGGGITVGTTTITSGTNTRVPFNDGGVYGEDAGLVYDKTNNALTVGLARIHTTGTNNSTFIGENSGNFTTTGVSNTGIGSNALNDLTDGGGNVAIGTGAGALITEGDDNVAIGHNSLQSNIIGIYNTAIGGSALNLATGDYNIGIGQQAGKNLTTGDQNIAIGWAIDFVSITANGQLNLQNVLYGTGNTSTGTTVGSGNLGFYSRSWGTSASRVLALGDVATPPSGNPTGAFNFWSSIEPEGSNLKIRTSDGHFAKPILQAKVTVAGGATLRGIGSAPVTLIAAPGANKYLNIISVTVSYNYGTTTYDFSATENLAFKFTGGAGYMMIGNTTMNSGVDFIRTLRSGSFNLTDGSLDALVNTAFVLTTADGGNATTGDGDLDIVVYYTVEDVNT